MGRSVIFPRWPEERGRNLRQRQACTPAQMHPTRPISQVFAAFPRRPWPAITPVCDRYAS